MILDSHPHVVLGFFMDDVVKRTEILLISRLPWLLKVSVTQVHDNSYSIDRGGQYNEHSPPYVIDIGPSIIITRLLII